MYTLENIAEAFGLKINTLRYWLKKNNDDCENNYYDFNLNNLMQKIKVYKKTKGKIKGRKYEQYVILDIDEFKREYDKYVNYTDMLKLKKHNGRGWSESARECYSCNMDCNICFNKDICSSVLTYSPYAEPPMKNFVIKLLSQIGKPPF